jgi:hypothetical protein
MELEKFEQAKKVKERLDILEIQKSKLQRALKSCSLGATIIYSTGGEFRNKGEVSLWNKEFIKEMISKELERLTEEMNSIKKEFENI